VPLADPFRVFRELAVHLTDDAWHMIEQFEASR
jgi:hypothetical protein